MQFEIFPRARLFSLACVFCLLFLVEGVSAGNSSNNKADIESAIAAVESGEYKKAFSIFQVLAKAGDPEAQHNLAMLYRAGKGVEKNSKHSVAWFRKAADQGIADSQYYLGYMYDTGEGLKKNRQYAYVWYHKAAEKGHGLAQINLGVLYANGLGVSQDVNKAYLWFHVAAAQGYKVAFENKNIIEKDMDPKALEPLKQEGRRYFQQYVLPYQRHSLSYPRLR